MTSNALNSIDNQVADTLFGVFGRVAATFPSRLAVKSAGRAYTYRELDERSSQVGRYLFNRLGAGSQPVAILIDDPADVLTAILGVLRSGNFYSVLTTRNPVARQAAILENLETPLLIVDASFEQAAHQAAPKGCSILRLDTIPVDSGEPFACPVSDEVLAGVYYTSGSTGEPKGVLRKRSAILSRALAEIEAISLGPQDTFLLAHLLSASASLSTVFPALLSGATLVIFEAEKHGVAPLREFALAEKITIFRITVELLRYFIDSLPLGTYFNDVRVFMSSGDVLYRRDLERIWKHIPSDAIFIHQLAASESSLLARNVLRRDTPLDSDIVPVGYPFAGREVFLLDENRNPVPTGNVGEICARTSWEFPGYWRRPDLTDEKFAPDPLDPAKKIYCSGDLGRFRPDGQLEFVGRKDARVKIRGFSVDMSAIESMLMLLPEIRRAVVVARQSADGRRRLVAYASPMQDCELDAKKLRAHIAGQLPDYMIPSAFVILPDFPLTATGKIDRKSLPEPDWNDLPAQESYTPPASELEEKLVSLWQAALGLEKIGVHDNFFELGGNSLMASALFVHIEREFGLRLPLSFIVENNTVRRMAEALNRPAAGDTHPLVPLQPEGGRQPLFLVPGAYGDAMVWHPMIPYVMPDQPLFGVQALRRDGEHLYKFKVEQIAERFVRDIQAFQPRGPYQLMGYSFGGLIALEMAHQLEGKGEIVNFLGLVDTSPPGSRRDASITDRVRIHIENLQALPWSKRGLYIKNSFKKLLIQIARRQAVRDAMPVEKWFPNDHRAATTLAIRSYHPDWTYAGNATVFKVSERPWYVRWDRMEGWSSVVTGKVTFREVPGNHGSVIKEPNIKFLAQALNTALQEQNS